MMFRLLFILLFLPTPPGKKVISGHLVADKPWDYENTFSQIILKSKGKIIGRSNISGQGGFIYTFPDRVPKQVDIIYTELGMGADMYLQHIDLTDTTDTIRLTIPIPAHVGIDTAGKAICPKCNRTDETRELVYGIAQVVTKTRKSGKVIYSPAVGNKYYMGSCMQPAQGPKWHCNRDNIFF
ncbi:hypothetical protein HHL17_25955 [Chitinophaga sp. G-6-1-13]|uniref:Uncharacterized protein n=1 Tax=Chitinophaga fulva TaxID=2728842 RepID=A0A848GYF3_9BACT|nr:hypothetical protein [Chitinophaga fulva]NML40668.1 hypothetical protein [Chitinophaga fulva]